MLSAEIAEARAEALLAAHLSPAQREEYARYGRVTVVKRGLVWSVLLRDGAKVLPLAMLLAFPAWRMVAFLLLLTLVLASMPLWLPRFLLASARRREWIVTVRSSPVVRARGRETRFCAMFREHLPAADRVLAWKHVLELSEAHFLRTANIRGQMRVRRRPPVSLVG